MWRILPDREPGSATRDRMLANLAHFMSESAIRARIIGIDCATEAKKTGLAVADLMDGVCSILDAVRSQTWEQVVEVLTGWLSGNLPTLLAIDAPLGWPTAMGRTLAEHMAGDEIQVEPKEFFKRETDRFIARNIAGCRPLEVGANLIARTAHRALKLLTAVRRSTNKPLSLAWSPGQLPDTQVIEVYPAATLKAYGISTEGYKAKGGLLQRQRIISSLADQFQLPIPAHLVPGICGTDHLVDALICILAGRDFLAGHVLHVSEHETAKHEGFIWVRRPIEGSTPRVRPP